MPTPWHNLLFSHLTKQIYHFIRGNIQFLFLAQQAKLNLNSARFYIPYDVPPHTNLLPYITSIFSTIGKLGEISMIFQPIRRNMNIKYLFEWTLNMYNMFFSGNLTYH